MSKKAKSIEKPVATARKPRAKKQPQTVQAVIEQEVKEGKLTKIEPKSVEVAEPAVVSPLKGEPESKPASKKQTGLRKPQIKVLLALAKTDKPLSRKELAEQAKVDQAMCTEYLGSNDEAIRLKNDAKVMPSLLTLGHIVIEKSDGGKASYSITASGRKAMDAPKE